jgi:hypothetical protein
MLKLNEEILTKIVSNYKPEGQESQRAKTGWK